MFFYEFCFTSILGGIHILRRQIGGREGVAKSLRLSTAREGGRYILNVYLLRPIRIRLYIKNETSLKKRNLERNRPKKTQPRRRQVSEKKKRNLPEGQVSEKKNATWPTARLRFF